MKKILILTLSLLLFCTMAQGATITRSQSGTEDTWHSGGVTLTSNSNVLSSNVTVTNSGYLHAWCTLHVPTFSVAPTASTAVLVWLRVSTDGGTTFPDGDASTTPLEPPHMTFPLRAVSTVQRISFRLETMPVGVFKVLIRNDGTGATMNTTWSLKCKPDTLAIN